MGYFYSGYDFAGIPIYVGTGVEDDWDAGDVPVLSVGDMFYTASSEGRIEISSRDVLIHGATWMALEKGAAFALRKGFLDATLFGSRYGPLVIRTARMGMNRMLMGAVFNPVFLTPTAAVTSAVAQREVWDEIGDPYTGAIHYSSAGDVGSGGSMPVIHELPSKSGWKSWWDTNFNW